MTDQRMLGPTGKPASKEVKAWACGVCGNVYRKIKHAKTKNGRAFADACCTCTVEGCGRMTGHYIGGRGQCEFHLAESDLKRAQEVRDGNQAWLERATERFERVKDV